ncbi:hypothetical protein QYE76_019571 [Lolium multiflorum]|uniref:Uncharacterized protein n=1 Tax=Lolium multiflorum TaxID=4521 RepID=A0AAD8R6S2_LOLMU|nr:hypothetical protein QYE76_019571 [Lolium multiflorum]
MGLAAAASGRFAVSWLCTQGFATKTLSISMNEVRKKLFTISLSGKAAHWYKLLKNVFMEDITLEIEPRKRFYNQGRAALVWRRLVAPLPFPLGLLEASCKIGPWALISSNSENISLLGFLKPKTAENSNWLFGMTALNLGRNRLTGEIPPSFAAFRSISFLSLTGNGFSNVTSALMILQRLPNLTSLVLTKNFHGGEEMPEAGIDGFTNIQVLVIANCELTGAIPAWIAGLSKLKVLDISWNKLAGPIPPFLGELDRLFYIDISNNSLQGEIPVSFTRMTAMLAGNGSDNDEDTTVQDFPFFMRRNVSASGRQYNQVSSFPPSLVLARNNLTGGVPPAMGALARLHIVDLS